LFYFHGKFNDHKLKGEGKYINTGMPAPDGYYYQQGDPQNILYDPNNRNLTKKRNEVHFTNKK